MGFGPLAKRLWVSVGERRRLEKVAWRRSAPYRLVLRARIVLMRARGHTTAVVADRHDVSDRMVRMWSARWREVPHLESLLERDRSGRKPRISVDTRCEVVKIACDRPERRKGQRRYRAPVWTQQAIADELKRTTRKRISRSSVQRILSASGLRPHRVRQWLHSPDPDFRVKVKRICGLYLDPPPDAVVLSIDEKPMQALRRRHPTHVGGGGIVRREYEYIRAGTSCLLGAFEVRTGRVFGRVVRRRTADALVRFLESVARHYPGREVYVIWDNLNIHYDGKNSRWTEFNRRHRGRFRFVYTPIHASWVNQIEIWFSILQRRVLRYGSFADREMLRDHVMGFIRHWNHYEAHPFRWTFAGDFVQTPPRAVV